VQYQTDEDLARLAGDIATTIFHPVGTTKIDNDLMAVGLHLIACAVLRLRVVDAGVMP
jgi:choline dehydrogenase